MSDIFDVIISFIEFMKDTNWVFYAFGSTWHIPLYTLVFFPAFCSLIWFVVRLIYDYTNY